MSIKSVLSVAVILGLTCAQVQADPKRRDSQNDPRGIYTHDSMDQARRDIRDNRLGREREKAESEDNGDPNKGWAFSILTIHHARASGYSYVQPTSYGVYASKADCEEARAAKVAKLETNRNDPTAPVTHPIRERHWMADAAETTTTTQIGAITTTSSRPRGPIEILLPQDCKPYTKQQLPPGSTGRRAENKQ
jgi:hypothetical protein